MVTALDKDLKRQVTVDGVVYTLTLNANGFRLTGKGKRKPDIELLWRDLLSGDAAMAVALNASLMKAARGGRTTAQAEQQRAEQHESSVKANDSSRAPTSDRARKSRVQQNRK